MDAIVRSVNAKFTSIDPASRKISGVACVFYDPADPGTQFELGKNHYERLHPQAFERTLKSGRTVFLLMIHDKERVLARSDVNLTLKTTARGLEFDAEVNDASWSDDALALVRGRQIGGCSFRYMPLQRQKARDGNNDITIIRDGILDEISIVFEPCYESTECFVRAIQEQENDLAEYEKRLAALDTGVIQA
jgi:HK97 family phage prohead protease